MSKTNQRNENDRSDANGRDDGGLIEVNDGSLLIDIIVFISGRGIDRRVSTIARVAGLDPDTGAYALADLPKLNPPKSSPKET